jgi:phosphoribosylanthranilate isomerase
MTRVKICGITCAEDALAAVEAGANALGLVFVPGTPRFVRPEVATSILRGLPPLVSIVGVFFDQPLEEVLAIITAVKLHVAQLHGHEPEAFSRRIPVPVIKALRVRDEESLKPIGSYPAQAYLLDADVKGQPGGTGRLIPWDVAVRATGLAPIILSGGLRPENVGEAVRLVRPFAVDVSSGVEQSPGRKDHRKVREFIANVRQADLG